MSGTSLDGVDAAIVELDEENGKIAIQMIEALTTAYSDELRNALLEVCTPEKATVQKIASLNMVLGKELGEIVNKLIKKAGLRKEDIHFISSHGQTIYHQPFQGKDAVDVPGTLQIGDISVLAETTGIAVVGDFRTADMAAGGQGAPLVSYLDDLLFRSPEESRALQNIGGIGNVTYLPAGRETVISYDTGPGNMVIDEVVKRVTNGEKRFDENGAMAYKGQIDEKLAAFLMRDEYFSMKPPKTTGRELFGKAYVDRIFKQFGDLQGEDLVATVTEWTAVSIAKSYRDFLLGEGMKMDAVIVSGGGSNNAYLLERLRYHLSPIPVHTLEDFGMSSDMKEAIAFAVMGYQCVRGQINQIPFATGAKKEVIMGKIAYTDREAFLRLNSIRGVK